MKLKDISAFEDITLGQTDKEKRRVIETNVYRYAIIRSEHEGKNWQYVGNVKPGDEEVFYFRPVSENGKAQIKRIHYHDLISLGISVDRLAMERF